MRYPWFVITGAPSSGKTTIINLLQEQGYHTKPEVARRLLVGKRYQESPRLEHRILRNKIRDHLTAPRDRAFFFDRGIPDSVAYYRLHGYPYDALLRHSLQYAQYQAVFLLAPLAFADDGLRSDYKDKVLDLHQKIKDVYQDLGIAVIEVPADDPLARIQLIKDKIALYEQVPTRELVIEPL